MGVSLLLASAASGCFARVFVHPLDTIRSRLMVNTSNNVTFGGVARELVRTDGINGLYRGFGISVCMQAPAMATFLTSYDWAKEQISKNTSLADTSPLVHLASGLVAEIISAVFWVPMEVIKQRAQVRRGAMAHASSVAITRDLLVHEGPRAFFKGYGLTLAVFGPYSMIYFMMYERFKSSATSLLNLNDSSQLSMPAIATCAASAGGIAATCTTPLDVIKTRWQTQGDRHISSLRAAPVYSSAWDAAKSIAVKEGFSGFFRGVSARVLWILPSKAITMTTFEFLKNHFKLSP